MFRQAALMDMGFQRRGWRWPWYQRAARGPPVCRALWVVPFHSIEYMRSLSLQHILYL